MAGLCPCEFMLTRFLSRNYAPGSWMFESGFKGFSGFHCLTITSLVWVGRLLLCVAFVALLFADALRIGEKKGIK